MIKVGWGSCNGVETCVMVGGACTVGGSMDRCPRWGWIVCVRGRNVVVGGGAYILGGGAYILWAGLM